MGLLDEAIRDHLELKRRGGADPTEVAREEREALEPVFPEEPRPEDVAPLQGELGPDDPDHPEVSFDHVPYESVQAVGMPMEPAPEDVPPADFAPLGEETAELDMQAFLDAEAATVDVEQPPEQMPGQERLTFE